jgi:hypothetical protein
LNPQVIGVIASVTIALVSAIAGASWKISSAMGKLRAELTTEMVNLKTEVAVMREREQQRGEKVEQMYQWWLKTIENGWIAHMKGIAAGKD